MAGLQARISWPGYRVIDYLADGKAITRRGVTLTGGVIDGELSAIEGYCHLRGAPRRFRVTGICAVQSEETGEVITEPERIITELAGALAERRRAKKRRMAQLGILTRNEVRAREKMNPKD